jgi:hypothetical protein
MIQRIQSLYLLCAIIFMAIFAFNPFIDLITPAGTYQMNCMGINLSTPSEISPKQLLLPHRKTTSLPSWLP